LPAFQKADGNCFLGRERSADVEIHATRDHSDVRSVLRNTRKLRRDIQNKRHGTQTVLLHDNACPHTVVSTRAHLENLNWELFDHPPYSPDLAPSDYHLFTYPKNWLRSQLIKSNEELMEVVKTWLSSQAADFFDRGIQKFIPHYGRCLSSGGDYVEK
jgi:hypothetical protein